MKSSVLLCPCPGSLPVTISSCSISCASLTSSRLPPTAEGAAKERETERGRARHREDRPLDFLPGHSRLTTSGGTRFAKDDNTATYLGVQFVQTFLVFSRSVRVSSIITEGEKRIKMRSINKVRS